MKMTSNSEDRFERDAGRYAAYLESPEGRLRIDLTLANLQDFLPAPAGPSPLRALDLGCGTGMASIRLARLGICVTSLDSSPAMLALTERATAEAGVGENMTLKLGDVSRLAEIVHEETFDIILYHNVLEFVDDPGEILREAVRLMRNSSSVMSVLVRNQAGEVLKAALQAGDLAAAENNLTAEWGQESLYGGRTRLFTPQGLEAMVKDASLTLLARRGVRTVADYLPSGICRSEEYERIFALERKLGARQEFLDVARYIHCLARLNKPAARKDQ